MEKVIENLKRFASEHGLILEEKGECGFGRECVGFLAKGGNYLDYCPHDSVDYEPIEGFEDHDLYAPNHVDAYHKHQCFSVLVQDEDYDEGLRQLNDWINHIESKGKVKVETFTTGATGLQALFTGSTGYALKFMEKFQ